MSVGRNEPCPCGSGRKYKHCCLRTAGRDSPLRAQASKFRFEPGSYGGPGRGYMPSVLCYEQVAPDQWREHFCLVNPQGVVENEAEGSDTAARDLAAAFAIKEAGGSDQELAACLRAKGYVSVEGFRRASTAGSADP